jgi:TIR domain
MPYSNSNTLNVFLSYASEDNKIAEALARTFRAAFVNAIDITMMGEFPGGLNWRRLIDESITRTDVLIAIASGRLKPSFSFTGFEIGSFSMSVRSQPKMTKFKNEDRRMIPFAVLARVPDAMNEFEGIDIDPTNLHDVRFDAKNIAEELAKHI